MTPVEELRRSPFFRLLFPLIGGIILGRNLGDATFLLWSCVGSSGILLGLSFLYRRVGSSSLYICFLIMGIALGRDPLVPPVPGRIITARICDETFPSGSGTRTLIDRIHYLEEGRWTGLKGRASVYFAGPPKEQNPLNPADQVPGNPTNQVPGNPTNQVPGNPADRVPVNPTNQIPGNPTDQVPGNPADRVPLPGTMIIARARLSPYPPTLNPRQFDYGAYQRGRGILYQVYLENGSWSAAGRAGNDGLRIRSIRLRRRLINKLESVISGRGRRAILHALLLGYRGEMDPEIKQNFIRSGTMHILAVSGLHVGILYLLPALLLRRLKPWPAARIPAGILVFAGLWMYAFLTGLSSSVVRAVCMCCIHGLAGMSGRKATPIHVLSLAAFIMIVARPAAVFEAGFQLSFTAVAGIILFYRRFLALFPLPGRFGRRVSQMLSVSLAAQLSTAPLSVYYFNQFATASFLANLVVIPLATLILYAGLFFFLAGGPESLSGILSGIPAYLLDSLSALLEWFTGAVAGIPWACAGGLTLLGSQVILLYAGMVLILLYLQRRTARSLFLLMGTAIIFLTVSVHREYRITAHNRAYIFALRGETAIAFVNGRQSAIFRGFGHPPDVLPYELEAFYRHYKLDRPFSIDATPGSSGTAQSAPGSAGPITATPGFPWYRRIHSPAMEAVYFIYREKRMLVLAGWDERYYPFVPSLPVDILVLCNNPRIKIDRAAERFNVSIVVADGSNYTSYIRRMASACRESGIPFHPTGSSGCFTY